jgi:hypothetical protein
MSQQEFEDLLRQNLRREPFLPFIVELVDGSRIIVPHSGVAFGGGAGAFFTPSYDLVEFACENVKAINPINLEAVP